VLKQFVAVGGLLAQQEKERGLDEAFDARLDAPPAAVESPRACMPPVRHGWKYM
jgi:hypothetical protein